MTGENGCFQGNKRANGMAAVWDEEEVFYP